MKLTGTWRTYPCYDINMIKEADREAFKSLPAGDRLYRCIGEMPNEITLEYGSIRFTADLSLYKPQNPPAFTFSEEVIVIIKNSVPERNARINGIFWHSVKNAPYYTLTFSGKRSSRRYWDSELEKLPAARSQ